MHVNTGVWKIRHSATVVEVHMRQHDVVHRFRVVAQASDLVYRGFFRVEWHFGDDLERAQDA